MLPVTFQIPAAIFLALGGAVACFAGYRFFRIVLGLYGFVLGALLATTIAGAVSFHGGEGSLSRSKFNALTQAQRDAVVAYVLSL